MSARRRALAQAEILRIIFEALLEDYSPYNLRRRQKERFLRLGRVCKSWLAEARLVDRGIIFATVDHATDVSALDILRAKATMRHLELAVRAVMADAAAHTVGSNRVSEGPGSTVRRRPARRLPPPESEQELQRLVYERFLAAWAKLYDPQTMTTLVLRFDEGGSGDAANGIIYTLGTQKVMRAQSLTALRLEFDGLTSCNELVQMLAACPSLVDLCLSDARAHEQQLMVATMSSALRATKPPFRLRSFHNDLAVDTAFHEWIMSTAEHCSMSTRWYGRSESHLATCGGATSLLVWSLPWMHAQQSPSHPNVTHVAIMRLDRQERCGKRFFANFPSLKTLSVGYMGGEDGSAYTLAGMVKHMPPGTHLNVLWTSDWCEIDAIDHLWMECYEHDVDFAWVGEDGDFTKLVWQPRKRAEGVKGAFAPGGLWQSRTAGDLYNVWRKTVFSIGEQVSSVAWTVSNDTGQRVEYRNGSWHEAGPKALV